MRNLKLKFFPVPGARTSRILYRHQNLVYLPFKPRLSPMTTFWNFILSTYAFNCCNIFVLQQQYKTFIVSVITSLCTYVPIQSTDKFMSYTVMNNGWQRRGSNTSKCPSGFSKVDKMTVPQQLRQFCAIDDPINSRYIQLWPQVWIG